MNEGLTAAHQPQTLFKPASWTTKIDFINHLILHNNAVVTILSEKNGGKTSFGSLLQSSLGPQIFCVSITLTLPFDNDTLFKMIAAELGIISAEAVNFESIVTAVNERKQPVVLFIDNAHHMPEALIKEALSIIHNQDDSNCFHLCLLSDYSIEPRLNRSIAENHINLVHTIEIGPMNDNETKTYVLQRALAKHFINKPLTEAQYKQFYQQTKGHLATINNNLEAFVFKCSMQHVNNKPLILKRVSAAAICACAIGGATLFFNKIDSNSSIVEVLEASTSFQQSELVQKPIIEATNADVDSQVVPWRETSEHPISASQEFLNNAQVATVNAALAAHNLAKEQMVEKLTQSPEIKKSKPKVGRYAVKKSAIISAPARYTIQIIASHKMNDLHHFRKNNHLINKTKIRHYTSTNDSWYVLTIGEYSSRNMAQHHANVLPAPLAKLKPWVRPVSGLSNIG